MGWEELETDAAHQPGWNGTFDNRVVLTNGQGESGAIYVGNLFINESPLRLIFDTGSDYLAITSSLCGDKRFDDEVTAAFDAAERAGSGGDSSTGGVGGKAAGAPPASSNVQLRDEKPQRCDSQAYSLAQSSDSQELKEDDVTLNYGSAHFKGKLYKDKVCIDPIANRCNDQFQFLALYQAKGLGPSVDGILGLANHKDPAKKHFNFV